MRVKTKRILSLTFFSVLLTVTLGLLIFAVITHEEPGLIRVCMDSQDRYNPECPEFSGWSTDDVPLIVGVTSSNPYPPADPDEAVTSVVQTINTRLGFMLLVVEEGGCLPDHDICVDVGVAHEPGFMDAHGDAQHLQTSEGLRCNARTSNTGTSELLYLVLQHELGHCIGLAHDGFTLSIMCGDDPYDGRGDCALPMSYEGFPPYITDDDRKTLRVLYGRE